MKSGKLQVLSMLALVIALGAQGKTQTPAVSDLGNIKTADFAWMTGRWIGHMENATAEQICSTPEGGEMLCLFRVFVQGKPVMYEIYSLFDTANGPQLRSLHFFTDLADKSLQSPLVMNLQKYSDKEVIFAGTPATEVETSSLFRDSPTTMNGVIIFRSQKDPHIRVRWEKVGYDARIDYNSTPQTKP